MKNKSLCIGELLKFGFETFKNNWGFYIGVLILSLLIPQIPHQLGYLAEPKYPIIAFILLALGIFLQILVNMGLVKIGLKFAKGEQPMVGDLYSSAPYTIKFFLGQILYTLAILIGLLLLIFPAFIVMARYGLFQYFILDKNQGVLESFRSSEKATMGAKWDYFSWLTVSYILMLAGFLCLILGLFVATPIVMVANALAYRKLVAQTDELMS